MTKPVSFGEYLGNRLAGHSGATVVKVDADYFDVEGIKRVARSMEQTVFMAELEGRKLNPLECFAIEVLIAVGGWKTPAEAIAEYNRYKSEK